LDRALTYIIVAGLLAASAGIAAYIALGGQHGTPAVQSTAKPAPTAETETATASATTSPGQEPNPAGATSSTTASYTAQTRTGSQHASVRSEVRSLPADYRDVIRCYPAMRANYTSTRQGEVVESGYIMYRLEKGDGGYVLTLEANDGERVKLYFDEALETTVKIVMPNGYVLTGPMAEATGKRILGALGNMVKSLSVGGRLEIAGGRIVSPDGTVVIVGSPRAAEAIIDGRSYEAYRVTLKPAASTGVDRSDITVANINGVWMVVGVESHRTDGTTSSWAITSLEMSSSCQR
jgi:hypothetical protein